MFMLCKIGPHVAVMLLYLANCGGVVDASLRHLTGATESVSTTASPSQSPLLSPSDSRHPPANLTAIIVGPAIGFVLIACGLSLVTCCGKSKQRTAVVTPTSSIPVSPAPGCHGGLAASKDVSSVMFGISISHATVAPSNSKSYPKVPSSVSNSVPKTDSALSVEAKISDTSAPPVTIQVFRSQRGSRAPVSIQNAHVTVSAESPAVEVSWDVDNTSDCQSFHISCASLSLERTIPAQLSVSHYTSSFRPTVAVYDKPIVFEIQALWLDMTLAIAHTNEVYLETQLGKWLQSEGLFDEAYVPTINHLSSGISELSSPIGTPTSPVVDTKDVLAQPLTALLSPLNDNSIKAIPLPKSARHRFQAALVKLRERNFVVD